MRRVMMAAFIAAVILTAPALIAAADTYVYVVVEGSQYNSSILPVPITWLGGTLYDTQQDALNAVNALAGTSIDNYYVWVCLDGACVPLDPYTVGN